MAIVYRHRRNDTNEIFYIGIGTTEKRAKSNRSRSKHWHNIVNKTSYEIEVLIENISWETAKEIEVGLIEYYGRSDNGTGILVNHTNGGDGAVGYKFDDKSKQARSKRMMGSENHFYNKTHSKEVRKILSEKCGKSGSENGFYSKTHSSDVKAYLGEIAKERYENGTLPKLPILYGSDNPSSKKIIAINHNTNDVYFIHGGIRKFCMEHKLSYHYYKKFCDNGKCEIIDSTHVRQGTKNIVDWEFRTASLAGGDWERIKKIIQTELIDCEITVVIYNKTT